MLGLAMHLFIIIIIITVIQNEPVSFVGVEVVSSEREAVELIT